MILVVDDEPGMTELLMDILEFYGHPAMVANNATEALQMINLQRPELILVDLMMPQVDGLSLALTLRHNPAMRDIPLVAMSASDSALELADRMGDFNAHISKPFENEELLEVIGRLMPVRS